MNWFLVWAAIALMVAAQGPALAQCVGDCDRDGEVRINELLTGVGITLGTIETTACPGFECPQAEGITITCLVSAVSNALLGCRAATPTGTATPFATPSQTPTVSTGFRIDGCVNEFPGLPCGANFETVRLETLGLTSMLDLDSDRQFHFENIPPGEYVLRVVRVCNPFGCWEEVPVTITDQDVYVTIDLIPNPTFTPAATCTLTTTPTPSLTATVTPTPTPTRTCPAAPPPATCPAGQVIACADQLCSIDCGCGTVTSTPTPTNTCTPGANPPPGCAYEGGTPTWTVTPCNEDWSTQTLVWTPQSTPTCTPHSAPDFPPCKPGQSLVCADQQCLLNCSCVDDTPTPLATPTGGPSLCRENADCQPSFQLCLEPGGFAGCGICYSDDAIDQNFRRCGTDEDCRDLAESNICEPLGHVSRTCGPCSGGPVTVCLSGCSDDDECNSGQVCVAHRCTGRTCSDAQTCPPQHTCVESPEEAMTCTRQICTNDADCGDDSCVQGFCYDDLGRCVAIPS